MSHDVDQLEQSLSLHDPSVAVEEGEGVGVDRLVAIACVEDHVEAGGHVGGVGGEAVMVGGEHVALLSRDVVDEPEVVEGAVLGVPPEGEGAVVLGLEAEGDALGALLGEEDAVVLAVQASVELEVSVVQGTQLL